MPAARIDPRPEEPFVEQQDMGRTDTRTLGHRPEHPPGPHACRPPSVPRWRPRVAQPRRAPHANEARGSAD